MSTNGRRQKVHVWAEDSRLHGLLSNPFSAVHHRCSNHFLWPKSHFPTHKSPSTRTTTGTDRTSPAARPPPVPNGSSKSVVSNDSSQPGQMISALQPRVPRVRPSVHAGVDHLVDEVGAGVTSEVAGEEEVVDILRLHLAEMEASTRWLSGASRKRTW